MPTVTGITPSVRREGRFDVQVDGRPAGTLTLEAIERLQLHVGVVVDERTAAALEQEVRAQHTMDRALNMLAFRARSIRELHRALVRKGEPQPLVDAAIERLTGMGLLDDRAYARGYVHAKVSGPGFSRRRLRGELARRGVARDVADEAIEAVFAEDAVNETEIIERVAAKKARTLARLDPDTRRRRLYAFLARRGYELDDIRRAMETALAAD